MSASYPKDSPESTPTTPRPKAPEDARLKSAWESGIIRIECYKIPSGEVFMAFRTDTGESILQESVVDRTGPEPVTREMPENHCYSPWTVLFSLAREWGQPTFERTWPKEDPVDRGIPADAFMEALREVCPNAPCLADYERKAEKAGV